MLNSGMVLNVMRRPLSHVRATARERCRARPPAAPAVPVLVLKTSFSSTLKTRHTSRRCDDVAQHLTHKFRLVAIWVPLLGRGFDVMITRCRARRVLTPRRVLSTLGRTPLAA